LDLDFALENSDSEELFRLFEKAEKRGEDVDDLPLLNRTKTVAFLRDTEK
jgi:hypothetical protein